MCRSFCFLAEGYGFCNSVIDREQYRVTEYSGLSIKIVESNSAVIFSVGITCCGALPTEK